MITRVRNRTTGAYDTFPVTRVRTETTNGVTVKPPMYNYTHVLPNYQGTFRTMMDLVNPNFRKVTAEGGIVNNPMTWDRESRSYQGSGASYTTTGNGMTAIDTITCDLPWYYLRHPTMHAADEALIALMRAQVATQARANIKAPSVQGLVMLAEGRKTLAMMANPMAALRKYILDPKTWKKTPVPKGSQARRGPKSSSEVSIGAKSWLEGRFGWRPFLMELDALKQLLLKGVRSQRRTSRAKQERTTEKVFQKTENGGGFVFVNSYTQRTIYTVRSGILVEDFLDFKGELGFRWADVPPAAYELIPYSFVLDWLLNLGNFIQALTPKLGVRELCAFTTIHVKRECVRTMLSCTFPGGTLLQSPTGVHVRTIETFSRNPAVDGPSLVAESSITYALRNGRVVDGLSLLIGSLGTTKRK